MFETIILSRDGVGMAEENGKLTDGIFLVIESYCGAPARLLLHRVLHDSVLLTFNCAAIIILFCKLKSIAILECFI